MQERTYCILGATMGWMHLFGGEGGWAHSTLGVHYTFGVSGGLGSFHLVENQKGNPVTVAFQTHLLWRKEERTHSILGARWRWTHLLGVGGGRKWTHPTLGESFLFLKEQRGWSISPLCREKKCAEERNAKRKA